MIGQTLTDPAHLILRYCKSDEGEAFSDFYNQQAPKLWRFLVARGCDPETAYDILSESFLRFSQSVCRDPRAPVALLYRIAINLHIDLFRHEKTARMAHDAIQHDNTDNNQSVMLDDKEHIRRLINSLEIDEQNLLLMRYWLGLTHKEVAQVLDIPAGTVRRKCADLLKTLAIKWQE